jgi:hypothetical protein
MSNSPADDHAAASPASTIRDRHGQGVPIDIAKAYHWSDWPCLHASQKMPDLSWISERGGPLMTGVARNPTPDVLGKVSIFIEWYGTIRPVSGVLRTAIGLAQLGKGAPARRRSKAVGRSPIGRDRMYRAAMIDSGKPASRMRRRRLLGRRLRLAAPPRPAGYGDRARRAPSGEGAIICGYRARTGIARPDRIARRYGCRRRCCPGRSR